MKTLLSILFVIFCLHFQAGAQNLKYTEIENELNEEQKEIFNQALKIIKKAQGNENNARAIDRKYSGKRNSSSWEEKTWEAKQQRILAERHYELAYSMISEIYSNLITNSEYESRTDKSEALKLNNEAQENFSTASNNLSQYKDVSREVLIPVNYEMLKADLKKAHELNSEGISYQIAALDITRTGIKTDNTQDMAAWRKAKSQNTTEAYNEYLSNYPNGNYKAAASARIRQLEKNTDDIATTDENENINTNRTTTSTSNRSYNNRTKSNNTNNYNNTNSNTTTSYSNQSRIIRTNYNEKQLVFKVQIAADRKVVPSWVLNQKAPGINNIERFRSKGWHKYTVGSFKSYHEAAQLKDNLISSAPDAFIVVFEKGRQIPVTQEMKTHEVVSIN